MLLLLLACTASAPLPSLGPTQDIFFVGVDVFTGADHELLRDQDVLVQAGHITSLAPTGGPVPGDALLVNGEGRTLLPAFIDFHTHLTGSAASPTDPELIDPAVNLGLWLRAGVGTIVDLGGDPKAITKVLARVASGEVASPRVFYTGSSITSPGAHPIPALEALIPFPFKRSFFKRIAVAESVADAPRAVAQALEAGGHHVKILYDAIPPGSPHMDKEVLRALSEAGHAAGKPVYAHVGSATDLTDALEAGIDLLAHIPYKDALSESDLEALGWSHVPTVATLSGFQNTAAVAQGTWQPSAMDLEFASPSWIEPLRGEAGRELARIEVLGEFANSITPEAARNVGRLADYRFLQFVGTDSPLPTQIPGSSFHNELAALVDAGLPSVDALLGATGHAAQFLDPEANFGTIAPGKVADLLLIDGDPIEDIHNSTRIVMVLREGRPVIGPKL